jgi:hypothetical protein
MTQDESQKPVADRLIQQFITALVANKPDEAANATKAMVDYVYTTPPQQEAKDEAWEKFCDSNCVWTDHHPDCKLAQRTWVGLTDKVITKVVDSMPRGINGWMSDWDLYEYARAIEAKLKEKNT